MKNLNQEIQEITDREGFVRFVQMLAIDCKENPNNWRNLTIADYLEALSAWTEDMDGYYLNQNLPIPKDVPWPVFASILIAAKVYEA